MVRHIVPILLNNIGTQQPYVEPFVGAFNVIQHMGNNRQRIANDVDRYIIAVYRAVINGWIPPTVVSESEYKYVRENKEQYPDYYVGFVGYAASYGGMWFAGYNAEVPTQSYIENAHNKLLAQKPYLKNIEIYCMDYQSLDIPPNSMIYCDPPYAERQQYGEQFDTPKFWDWVRERIAEGHDMLVSEYTAPSDFVAVYEIEKPMKLGNKYREDVRYERLFVHREYMHRYGYMEGLL